MDDAIFYLLLIALLMPVALRGLTYRIGIRLLEQRGLVRRNWQGERIPTAGGLLVCGWLTVTLLVVAVLSARWGVVAVDWRLTVLFVCGSVAMALWGWQDDRSTDKQIKGIRGHLSVLVHEQRMTSGLLKAWGGIATALLTALAVSEGGAETAVNTGLLALSANLINLFDLRPGRALKVFWLICVATLTATPLVYTYQAWLWFLPVMSATLSFFPCDARGEIMLGDAGANYLGFVVGFSMMATLSLPLKTAVVCVLAALHAAAERVSFSRVIQSVPWLNQFDRWGRRV